MKKIQKKAFTLVELLVVIAILAVLATVAILGYSSFTNRANQSNDATVVAELNRFTQAYIAGGGEVNTVTDIANELEKDGFKLSTIKTSYKKDYYAFNVNKDKKEFLVVTEEDIDKKVGNADIFVFVASETELQKVNTAGYSAYLQEQYDKDVISTDKGVDVGVNNHITSISYTNPGEHQEVVIRTNSANTNLTIDDASEGTIYHYGSAGALNIIQCHTASYRENGTVAFAEIAKGRIVLEFGSKIEEIHINKKENEQAFNTVIITNNGGSQELPERITRDAVEVANKTLVVKVESNESSEDVYVYASGETGTTEKVTEGSNKQNENVNSSLGQLVLDNGSNPGEKAQTAEQKATAKDEVIEEAKSKEIIDKGEKERKNYIARIGMVGYESLKDALAAANNNETIYLVSDDDSEEQLSLSKPIVLNMSGNTYAGNFRLAYDGVTVNGDANVTNSAASLTIDKNTIYYGLYQSAYNKANSLLTDGIVTANESASRVTLKLLADFKVPGPANYGRMNFDVPMTLDLNGYTLEFGTTVYSFQIKDNFILKDSSAEKNGVLLASRTGSSAILLGTSTQSATFTLESGTIQSESYIFDTYNNCSINITGGHLVSFSKYGTGDSRSIVQELSSGCTFTMSGGEYRSDQSAKSWDSMSFDPMGYPVKNVNSNSTIAVTGGSFSGQAIQRYVPGYVSDQSFTNENPTIVVGNYQITRTTISSPYGAAPYDVYLYTVEEISNN